MLVMKDLEAEEGDMVHTEDVEEAEEDLLTKL